MFALEIPLPGTHIINVSNDVSYFSRHRVGDRMAITETVLGVTGEKSTRLGVGYFITTSSEYTSGDDLVATAQNVLFRYMARP
jgi:hypothetical protein